MSLGAPRQETDKSGQTCMVSDVAINSIWYSDTLVIGRLRACYSATFD